MENSKIKSALNDFSIAYGALKAAWDEAEPIIGDALDENYPFERSFNDYDIESWINSSTNNLNKK